MVPMPYVAESKISKKIAMSNNFLRCESSLPQPVASSGGKFKFGNLEYIEGPYIGPPKPYFL